jgi:TolA-binding protein
VSENPELEEVIDNLRDTVDKQGRQLAQIRGTVYRLADTEKENPTLNEALQGLEDRIESLEKDAEEAKTEAEISRATSRAIDDGTRADGSPTKKDRALWLSRDECVRRALLDGGSVNTGGSVTTTDVKNMAKPETKLYQRTVEDAWDELVMRHDDFAVVDPDDKPKRLQVDVEDLSTEVVSLVEESLGRDGLTERLHSERRAR